MTQLAECVTATGNCVAQTAVCVTAMPDCAMQLGTAVTLTGNSVTQEPAVASHEAGSCLVTAVAHHPSAVATLGLVFL
jgi:hypothetical protein